MFLLNYLAFGTIFFWVAFIGLTFLILILDELEKEGGAFFSLLIFTGLVITATPTWLATLKAHPLYLVEGVAAYLVLGIITAVVKWYFFLLNVRDVASKKDLMVTIDNPNWISATKTPDAPRTIKVPASHDHTISLQVDGRSVVYPVQVSDFKTRIVGWMTYWPWVGVWTLINDPIRRAFQHVYRTIAGLLQRMTDSVLRQNQTDGNRIEPDKPWPRG